MREVRSNTFTPFLRQDSNAYVSNVYYVNDNVSVVEQLKDLQVCFFRFL